MDENKTLKPVKLRKANGIDPYYYEGERRDKLFNSLNKSLYVTAEREDLVTTFELGLLETANEKLKQIEKEILIRIKITNQEIFLIGELLCKAKQICHEGGIGFQKWIEDQLDFSYETANNFMSVYRQCFGFRELALNLPPSILYKISAPNFPEELREFLFIKGNMEKMTGGKFKNITQKYKEGGLEAVKEDIEELGRANLAFRQCGFSIDVCENLIRNMADALDKIKSYRGRIPYISGFAESIKQDEPEAREINKELHDALSTAYKAVDDALTICRLKMDRLKNRIRETM